MKEGDSLPWLYRKFFSLFIRRIDVVKQLTPDYLKNNFNVVHKDNPDVKYFSLGGTVHKHFWLYTQNPWVITGVNVSRNRGVQRTDGFVSEASSKWGKYLGTVMGDHWAQTAWVLYGGKVIYKDVFWTVFTES